MRQLRALAWKETRETLIYLWIGLFCFLGLPIIGGIEEYFRRLMRYPIQLEARPWIIPLGGVLAVFVGVGATCRDLSPKLLDFWHSRPVTPRRWMLMKFMIGWIVVELACIVPALIAAALDPKDDYRPLTFWLPGLWSAAYALAFLAGCLLRRTAHAAMLGLSALLLLWALPAIVPALSWIDPTFIWMNAPAGAGAVAHRHYLLGMTLITAMALAAALLIAQRDWQIQSDRKLMYGSITAALLILLGSLTLRLGTNLPELHHENLQPFETVRGLKLEGLTGQLLTERADNWNAPYHFSKRAIQIEGDSFTLGPPQIEGNFWDSYNEPINLAMVPHYQQYAYDVVSENPEDPDKPLPPYALGNYELILEREREAWGGYVPRRLAALWPQTKSVWPRPIVYGNKLYVLGEKLAIFDLADALHPKLLGISDQGFNFLSPLSYNDATHLTLLLPPLPEVPARERLKILLNFWHDDATLEDDLLCWPYGNGGVAVYRITQLTDSAAVLLRVAVREPDLVERLFGYPGTRNIKILNGLLYQTTNRSVNLNNSVTVYDARNGLKQVGHFAAPGIEQVYPLPDGRAIIAGSRVYLVGPPPKR